MKFSTLQFKSPTRPAIYSKYRSGHPYIWSKLSKLASLNNNSITVDVGCGPGVEAKSFSLAGSGLYIGLDRAFDTIYFARDSVISDYDQYFICGDASHMPFKDESIDFISFVISLHQMHYNEKVIIEACRVLKKKGSIAVVDVPHKERIKAAEFKFFPDLSGIENERRNNFTEKDTFNFLSKHLTNLKMTWEPYLTRHIDMQLVKAIKHKYFSSLKLIEKKAFQKGLIDLTNFVEETGGLEQEEIFCFIIIGEKES